MKLLRKGKWAVQATHSVVYIFSAHLTDSSIAKVEASVLKGERDNKKSTGELQLPKKALRYHGNESLEYI